MKRIAGKTLIWIGNGLLAIAAIVIGASMLFGWYQNGFGWVQETFSPFNLWNFIATLIVLAPGFGLRMSGEKLLELARPDDEESE